MQTVQFQCGHCGKLMAVGSDHLGQQVRCPHCQQVVIAPPPAEAPPPQMVETILHVPPPTDDAEDIFSPPDVSDDLFGRHEPPRVEMPPQPLAPTLPGNNAFWPPPSEANAPSTLPFVPPSSDAVPPSNGEGTAVLPSSDAAAPWLAPTEMLTTTPSAGAPASFPDESAIASTPIARARGRSESSVPWFLILVFSPLLLYAIVITIFSVMLYRQEQDVEDKLRRRFEIMPDEGDKPGVQKGKKVGWRWDYDSKLPIQPLPANLCTTLGQREPLRIGDLEIKPLRVERKFVKVVVANSNPEPCPHESLVLYLNLKNVSTEYAFAPLDNYFDRCYHGGALPPFTLLEVGEKDKQRFYGGPADWYSPADSNNKRQWVQGRHDRPEVLQPGEAKEYFVCTNGYDAKEAAVLFGRKGGESYHGSFLWRVRVRRGLVSYENKVHSATAVIGVRFTDKDITSPG